MNAKTWLFEGEQRTVAQIRKLVPALSNQAIRNRLAMGQSTIVEMLTYVKRVPKASTRFCGELKK